MDLKKKLKRSANPDFLFLEPSEMVVTKELRSVLSMGLRDIRYAVGPFITLVDAPSFPFNFEERKSLILGQIRDADLIAVSRADRIDKRQINEICGGLQLRQKETLLLGCQGGDSLDMLGDRILSLNESRQ